MSLNTATILSAVRDHAQTLGAFEVVDLHEPKNAPGDGLTAAFWVTSIAPVASMSGLNTTSFRLVVTGRVYLDMLYEPQDQIDTVLLGGVDLLMASYSSGFTLGGLVEEVDLLGEYGESLSAQLQYATHNHKLYRIATITLPVVVADLYAQGA